MSCPSCFGMGSFICGPKDSNQAIQLICDLCDGTGEVDEHLSTSWDGRRFGYAEIVISRPMVIGKIAPDGDN